MRFSVLRQLLVFFQFTTLTAAFAPNDVTTFRAKRVILQAENEKVPTVIPLIEHGSDDHVIASESEDEHPIWTRRSFLLGSMAATTIVAASLVPGNAHADTSSPILDTSLLPSSSPSIDWAPIFQKASKKALSGGKAGASAAVVQVCSLMWMRTSMNYQYRYGGSLGDSLRTLYSEGGIARLYQGLPFAIVQGPITRFGDTAANVGVLALLESTEATAQLPLPIKTLCGSLAAGAWRILLMPIDTSKTAMQVEGSEALRKLWEKVGKEGPGPLYRGAFASAGATAVGHFPWFLTYNFLDEQLPKMLSSEDLFLSLLRAAFLGLSASCVSDCASNSLRVIKTTKQTASLGKDGSDKDVSYREIVVSILEEDGIAGLLGRGLQTRLLTNAIQGAVFSVLWKYFQQLGST